VEVLISFVIGAALIESYVWLDPICKRLVGWAAEKLPAGREEEFRAQWEADLAAVPNSIFKFYFVLRDCVLPIKDIQQTMFREQFAEIADSVDGMIDLNRLSRLELRSSAALARSESMASKLVGTLDDAMERVQKLHRGDASVLSAIERCESLKPILLNRFSEFHAAVKCSHDAMLQTAMALREKLGEVSTVQARIRERLLDSKPLTDDDGDLLVLLETAIDRLLEAIDSFGNAAVQHRISPSDMSLAARETCEAYKTAMDMIKRTRSETSSSSN
jgi:hypothetical protein